jgi:hypothetical protein
MEREIIWAKMKGKIMWAKISWAGDRGREGEKRLDRSYNWGRAREERCEKWEVRSEKGGDIKEEERKVRGSRME